MKFDIFVLSEPLVSWGTTFSFSIWFVELIGVDDDDCVKVYTDWFNSVS